MAGVRFMIDRTPFLTAIRQRPNDPLPRLVYADFLDENAGHAWLPCPSCGKYVGDPESPWGGEPGYRPERDPASGRHEGGWANCKTCNAEGHSKAGFVWADNGFAIEAALQRVLAEPDEGRHRLAYADAVEGTDPERAEFVRVQVELAGIDTAADAPGRLVRQIADRIGSPPVCVLVEDEGRYRRLRRRERELLGVPASDRLSRPIHFSGVPCMRCNWHVPIPHGGFSWMFRKGFVDWINCSAADFFRHAEAITDATPLREVRLTTWPECNAVRVGDYVGLQFVGRETKHRRPSTEVENRDWSAIPSMLAAEWPRIKFSLLPPQTIFRNTPIVWVPDLEKAIAEDAADPQSLPVVGGRVAEGGDQVEV